MNSINISLESLEYSLIKNKCEYLYGFKDQFLKYNKNDIFIRFSKIADDLENQKLISRSFSGDVTYDDEYKKILETIINVEIFYEIAYVVNSIELNKYRIYVSKNNYVLIKISCDEDNELNYKNMEIDLLSQEKLLEYINKFCENENITPANKIINESTCVSNDYLEKIKKSKNEDFIKIINEYNYTNNEIINKLNVIIKNPVKLISILKTDMHKRKSEVFNYLYDIKSLLKMEFKIEGEKHNWIINEVSNELLIDEIKQIIKK